MHAERYESPSATARCDGAKRGGRVVAVGTTVVRTLETASAEGQRRPRAGRTDLFITPGYHFRAVDAPVHQLPPAALDAADAGARPSPAGARCSPPTPRPCAQRYRFFSYGDAMLIL